MSEIYNPFQNASPLPAYLINGIKLYIQQALPQLPSDQSLQVEATLLGSDDELFAAFNNTSAIVEEHRPLQPAA
ncbi:MAG TPA: hypothetical protein VLG27_04065 [Candidatus Saccharimonadia bacterium]|nr:hypothetical protein [Candidatus Saccharimonadia bacterium]